MGGNQGCGTAGFTAVSGWVGHFLSELQFNIVNPFDFKDPVTGLGTPVCLLPSIKLFDVEYVSRTSPNYWRNGWLCHNHGIITSLTSHPVKC